LKVIKAIIIIIDAAKLSRRGVWKRGLQLDTAAQVSEDCLRLFLQYTTLFLDLLRKSDTCGENNSDCTSLLSPSNITPAQPTLPLVSVCFCCWEVHLRSKSCPFYCRHFFPFGGRFGIHFICSVQTLYDWPLALIVVALITSYKIVLLLHIR